MRRTVLVALALLAPAWGCIRPPQIVVVDRATALEEQAGGSFDEVEHKLDRAGMAPAPEALTPDQLDALGIRPLPLVDNTSLTFSDQLDGMLLQHCVGEGRDGLLVDTFSACRSAADPARAAALVERANGARLQLWRWMHAQRPDQPVPALRAAWHEAHLADVVCGAWVQRSDGAWEEKKC